MANRIVGLLGGGVNTSHLTKFFNQLRPKSQKDLKAYQEVAPDNIFYDNSKKMNVPCDSFQKHFITGDVDEYLNWLQDPQNIPLFTQTGKKQTFQESMVYPARSIAPKILRTLVRAIKDRRYVDVCYKSMKHPEGDRRIIAPHSLVNTGLRWHVRVWCENNNDFRDMVLNRFTDDMDLIEPSNISASNDEAWNTQVTLKFRADQRLSDAKKQILENDYQMVDGEFSITTRGCLVEYQLKALQVSPKILDGNPDAQQLVLANLNDIKPWLFDS